MRSRFNNMGQVGVIKDLPPWELPEQAWSDSLNVKYQDNAVQGVYGHEQVFGALLGAPKRIHPISTGEAYYWVYAGDTAIYATNGTVQADITNTSIGSYTSSSVGWNGGAFQRYMVLNNGVEPPQYWQPDLSLEMDTLSNWETGLKAEVIRPFRNFLFALRCTEGTSLNPRLIRHSNGATAGNLPSSWDYTDPNEDTGRVEFGQTTDNLVDALAMRDLFIIYKENHTWAAQYVGGVDNPFIYRQIFSQLGLLGQYCASAFEGKHFVLSSDDVVVHDANQPQSVIDRRVRNYLFNSIDVSNYKNCFTVVNHREKECWACYPESGFTYPNMAMIWNWRENTVAFREIGFECPHINFGVVSGEDNTFDGDVGTFDSDTGPFDAQLYNPSVTALLMADYDNQKLFQNSQIGTFAGQAFQKRMTREALPFDDFLRHKRIHRVFPKLIGVPGEVIQISIGARNSFEEATRWSAPQNYTIGSDVFASFRITGRIIDIEFTYNGSQSFRLHGFDIEWEPAGLY